MKAILLGDAMIPGEGFGKAWEKHLSKYGKDVVVDNWESDWGQLQYRRLEVEKFGPEIETVDETILKEGKDADVLMGLFVPISSKVMDAMPNLRIAGVCRAGVENVNVEEATKRGILVFNVKGRNAHAARWRSDRMHADNCGYHLALSVRKCGCGCGSSAQRGGTVRRDARCAGQDLRRRPG